MKDYRDLLTNGVFGEMSNGKQFVVVGDHLVYKSGGYDKIEDMGKDLQLSFYCINYLVETVSFEGLVDRLACYKLDKSDPTGKVIYDRHRNTVVEMTIEEIEQKLGVTNLKIIKGNK